MGYKLWSDRRVPKNEYLSVLSFFEVKLDSDIRTEFVMNFACVRRWLCLSLVSLAACACAKGNTLYFPHIAVSGVDLWRTDLVVINPTAQASTWKLEAYQSDGKLLSTAVPLRCSPARPGPKKPGLSHSQPGGSLYYFPVLPNDASWTTYLALSNAAGSSALVSLTAQNVQGMISATRQGVTLGAGARFFETLDGAFGGASLSKVAWVKVSSTQPLMAVELSQSHPAQLLRNPECEVNGRLEFHAGIRRQDRRKLW